MYITVTHFHYSYLNIHITNGHTASKVLNNYPRVMFHTKMLKDANFYCLYLEGNVLNKITTHLSPKRLIAIKVQHNLYMCIRYQVVKRCKILSFIPGRKFIK